MIGIAGAIGAFGGFLIQVVFRQASLGVSALVKAAETPAEKLAIAQAHADWSVSALWVFLGAYVVFAGHDLVLLPAEVGRDGARPEPRVRVGVGDAQPCRRPFRSPRRIAISVTAATTYAWDSAT